MADDDSNERSWWRKLVRGLGLTLLGLLALIISVVLAVLWIPAASQLAARIALERWDAAMPGAVRWSSMRGSLASKLEVHGFALADREGRPLVEATRVEINLDASALVSLELALDRVYVHGAEVWADHTWQDLAPPVAPEVRAARRAARDGFGPDFPVRLTARAEISEGVVYVDDQVIVRHRWLLVDATARGRTAEAKLTGMGIEMPSQDLLLASVDLHTRWAAPDAIIDVLQIDGSIGQLRALEPIRFDVESKRGGFVLEGEAPSALLAAQAGLDIAEPERFASARVRVSGQTETDLEVFTVDTIAELDDSEGERQVLLVSSASSHEFSELWGEGWFRLDGLGVRGSGVVVRSAAQALDAHATIDIPSVARPLRSIAAQLGIEALREVDGSLHLEAGCATASGAALETLACPVDLDSSALRGFGARAGVLTLDGELRPLTSPPRFDASLDARALRYALAEDTLALDRFHADAHGTPERIRVEARGRGPHEQLELAASVEPGATLTIGLDALALETTRLSAPAAVELLEPTEIRVESNAVAVDELELAALGARIAVDGRVGFGPGAPASEVEAQVDDLSLTRLDPLVPGPELAGTVDLELALRGSIRAPRGTLALDARALAIAQVRLGDATLAADLVELDAGPELVVEFGLDGPLAERASVAGAIPLRLRDGPGLARGRALALDASVDALDLVELGFLMPATPAWWRQVPGDPAAPEGDPRLIPAGEVDLDLSVSGTAGAPTIELTTLARELVIDRTALGSALARARYADGTLGVDVDVKLPFGFVDVSAAVPATLDLARAEASWSRRADHRAFVDVRGLNLDALQRTLGPKLPALDAVLDQLAARGELSATLAAEGSAEAPIVSAQLRAPTLELDGRDFGDAKIDLAYEAERAIVDAYLRGPIAARADLHAELPVDLRPRAGALTDAFDTHAPLVAEVHIRELSLASLRRELRLSGMPEELDTRLDLDLDLDGSLADPKLVVEARAAELSRGEDPIGDLSVHARLAAAEAAIDLDLVREGRHLASVELSVPLLLALDDLSRAELGWDHEGHHRVRATGRGLDGELLASILGQPLAIAKTADELPYGAEELSVELGFDIEGGGMLSDYELLAELHGEVRSDEELTLALDGELELDEQRQRARVELDPSSCDHLELAGHIEADLLAMYEGRQRPGEIPFAVELDAPDFDLATLAPLTSVIYEPEGQLQAAVEGEGTLAAPMLSGQIEIDEGAATILAFGQRVHGLDLDLAFEREHFELREFVVEAGSGSITGQGQADIDRTAGIDSAFELEFDDVPLIRPGLPAMVVDSRIGIEFDLEPGDIDLRIAARETEVEVALSDSKAPARLPNDDFVLYVDEHPEQIETLTSETDASETGADVSASLDDDGPRFHLDIELVDPVQISGTAVDMSWAGSVALDNGPGGTRVDGELEARRGRLELLGHSFELRRGIVNLPADGSLIPFIDVMAVTSTERAEVRVEISGRVTEPSLHFASNPAMREFEILALLVTGSTEIGENDAEIEAQAAGLLAAVSNPQLARQLDRHLGIDRLRLGFGDTIDQPVLSVGKRLTEDLLVEATYHHNAPDDENMAELSVEYDFTQRWSLQTHFGDAAVGGAGVFWTFAFGGPQWRSAPASDGEDDDSDSDSDGEGREDSDERGHAPRDAEAAQEAEREDEPRAAPM